MLILLVGLTSSGKTTVAKILEEKGFSIVCTGDVIRDEIKSRGMVYSIKNDREMAKWFHDEGEELIIERIAHKLRGDNVVIDGIRSAEMLEKIEQITGNKPVILLIFSDFKKRFCRECERKKFPGFTKEDMKKRDDSHMDIGTKYLIERADYTIDNTNLTKDELKEKLEKILENINI